MSPESILRKIRPAAIAALLIAMFAPHAEALTPPQLERASLAALSSLYARNSKAAEIGRRSVGALIFPGAHMLGAGLAVQTGSGVFFYKNTPRAYFNLSGASVGLEVGIQKFDLILFFEDDAAVDKLYQVGGFEIGTAPSLVIFDGIFAGKLSTSSVRSGIDAFISSQQGLMISFGLGKNKFTEYIPGN
jgi:lipid-binding SYLF domain-containing protein